MKVCQCVTVDPSTYCDIVFLGGSCNPTTWRKDMAIPFFTKHQITFYNPVCPMCFWHRVPNNVLQQVEEWTPDLVEIENNAKSVRQAIVSLNFDQLTNYLQNASLLFFMIDNQTRGVSSMVEVAYLAAAGRNLVVVIQDFDEHSAIDAQSLSHRYAVDQWE